MHTHMVVCVYVCVHIHIHTIDCKALEELGRVVGSECEEQNLNL